MVKDGGDEPLHMRSDRSLAEEIRELKGRGERFHDLSKAEQHRLDSLIRARRRRRAGGRPVSTLRAFDPTAFVGDGASEDSIPDAFREEASVHD